LQLASLGYLLPDSTTETKCNYAQAEKSKQKAAIKPSKISDQFNSELQVPLISDQFTF
jgi:hypothetical protein